eukprot:358717-Chlamydomonas_euryale.AAC.1
MYYMHGAVQGGGRRTAGGREGKRRGHVALEDVLRCRRREEECSKASPSATVNPALHSASLVASTWDVLPGRTLRRLWLAHGTCHVDLGNAPWIWEVSARSADTCTHGMAKSRRVWATARICSFCVHTHGTIVSWYEACLPTSAAAVGMWPSVLAEETAGRMLCACSCTRFCTCSYAC